MRRIRAGLLAILLLPFLLTGCWDRRELNDRLFDLGSGVDLLEDNKLLLIGQFMIPSNSGESGGGAKQSYFIETGTGKTVSECLFDLQLKLSRKITRGHRNNIYFGEEMAKAGIADLMDSVTRDPDSRLKSDLWVVKGGTALDFMRMSYPLEKMPAIALSKLRQTIGKKTGNSLLELLIEQNVEGSGATLPAVEIAYDSKLRKKTLRVYGRAVLNRQQQLTGYFDRMESVYRLWVTGETDNVPITMSLTNGLGSFSVNVRSPDCKVRTTVKGSRVDIDVELTGSGVVQESLSPLDLRQPNQLRAYETELNHHIETAELDMIRKAQKQFKVDVFHFGQSVARQHPEAWAALEARWAEAFADATVTVRSRVKMSRIGLQGPPPNKSQGA